jgi:hypothetical protein
MTTQAAYNARRTIPIPSRSFTRVSAMRRLTIAALFLTLCAAGLSRVPAQEPKPAVAVVTITDTVTGMSRLDDKKMELRLSAPPKSSILTAPHVLVDESKTKVNPFAKRPVAFQGQLSTKEVVVGMTGSIPPGKIKAKALYLVAALATEITDDNKAKFPAAGQARVEGKLLKGAFAAGKAGNATHAIENGTQPILLLAKDGTPVPNVPDAATVVASGRLRVADNGALVLDTETVEKGAGAK